MLNALDFEPNLPDAQVNVPVEFSPASALIARYEEPLPLHQLTIEEMEALRRTMTSALETWAQVRVSAGLKLVPGWVQLASTELGFIQAALDLIPLDGDVLPPN